MHFGFIKKGYADFDKIDNRYISAVIFFITVAVSGFFSRLGIDVHHQGMMFQAAMKVEHGYKLYKEAYTNYGPFVTLLQALALRVFGDRLIVIQLQTAFVYGIIAICLYIIWRKFLNSFWAFFSWGLWLLLAPYFFWEFHPWSSVYALCFLLISLISMWQYYEKFNPIYLTVVGIFLALTFWTRQSVGIFLTIGILFLFGFSRIILEKTRKYFWSHFLFFLLGAGVVSILFLIWLIKTDILLDWWRIDFVDQGAWALNKSGASSTTIDKILFIFKCLFQNFQPTIWVTFPVITLIIFINSFYTFITQKASRTAARFQFHVIVVFSLVSWLQYYPAAEARHFYWSAAPMVGILILGIQKLIRFCQNKVQQNVGFLSISYKVITIGIIIAISYMYSFEVYRRFVIGMQFDAHTKLIGAPRRIKRINTMFESPHILQGMYGYPIQVKVMKEVDDTIQKYLAEHPDSYLISKTPLDYLFQTYYLTDASKMKDKTARPLIHSDGPLQMDGYYQLAFFKMNPPFAFTGTLYGEIYLYAPIEDEKSAANLVYEK